MDTTIKVSRELFENIVDRARRGESRDQTLRRVLGLAARVRRISRSEKPLIKVSREVRRHIWLKSLPSETVDLTLRRLLRQNRKFRLIV